MILYRNGKEGEVEWKLFLDGTDMVVQVERPGYPVYTERVRLSHEPTFGLDVMDAINIDEVLDEAINNPTKE